MERWVEEIEGWDSRPFSGGYAGLHDLADDSFSGAVSAGSTWLLFVNGRVVSVGEYRRTAAGDEFEPGEPGPDGDIQTFDGAEGTVYEAPHPAVPLLAAMQFADGESRGRYYTEKTPISEVQETLSEGGFTGYVELSENVLSGDYYEVYQGGRSMNVAFVGNARRLKTDEEALELTRDEVGIYEVIAADLDVTEIPEPSGGSAAGAAGGLGAAGTGAGATEPKDDDPVGGTTETEPAEGPADSGDELVDSGSGLGNSGSDLVDTGADQSDSGADPTATEINADESPSTTAETQTTEPAAGPDTGESTAGERARDDTTADTESAIPTEEPDDRSDDAPAEDPLESPGTGSRAVDSPPEPRQPRESTGGASTEGTESEPGSPGGSAAASPTEQLASRSVPSLDPERTGSAGGGRAAGGRRDDPTGRNNGSQTPANGGADTGSSRPNDTAPETTASSAGELTELREEVETLRGSLQTVETERDEARAELAEVESELERVKAERNDLIDERDALEAEADRLRARVAELEEQAGLPSDGPSLSEAEALAGTNLFVRYESKGMTTVEDAHDGSGSPDDLETNLRISAHTQFESEDASVAGEPFDEWLHGSQRYRFAEWLVSQLVFEIRDTGSADSMRDLYDVLPRIDRIEFDAAIAVDSEDGPDEVTFDVVCRDRMGEPLVVAGLDASREPVEEAEMAELVTDAIAVCRSEEPFAAAFYVTAAFFESPALETARDATSGSLLSRDSRRSYVKESRKRGFHLGLVESRDGAFHLSVPDL